MELWEAVVLGMIQGLTEFLPVSSSGHLEIANALFGLKESNNLAFTVAVHGATVLSTLIVFWKEIVKIIAGVFKFEMNKETYFMINILISLLPVIFIGLFFKPQIEALFTSNLLLVGSMLLVTAVLLTISQYVPRKDRPVTMQTAFIMGIAQAVAVIPGLSRSGSTISTGLMCGAKPEEVTKFSFLMVLIPIIGMNFLDLMSGSFISAEGVGALNIAAGAISAFIFGLAACTWMINIVKKGKLIWFAVYCVAAGSAAIIYSLV